MFSSPSVMLFMQASVRLDSGLVRISGIPVIHQNPARAASAGSLNFA
ncbi:hypothetical protein [Rhizobium binxianense]